MNKCQILLQADEIDHITIRYTDFGEALKRKDGIKKVLLYNDCYAPVKAALSSFEINEKALYALSDEELYRVYVAVRTALLEEVLPLC